MRSADERGERSGSDPVLRRLKVLRAMRRSPHRYDRLRALGMTVSLGILFGVPLSGLAQVDLWRGAHRVLFEPAPLAHAVAAVIVAISALYVVTFLSNVVAGRLFCGWGCPVGQISRFGEVIDTPRLDRTARWKTRFAGGAFGLAFVASVVVWWVDPAVFVRGSVREAGTAWAVLALLAVWSWLHGRHWRWGFCMSACPIGLYYSFVSPAHWYGVHFRNEQSTCIECDACDNVCPVHLRPRDLATPIAARGGIAIADAPGRNHCLECGDCVRACDWIVGLRGSGPVPLRLGYHAGPQRIDAPAGAGAGRAARADC